MNKVLFLTSFLTLILSYTHGQIKDKTIMEFARFPQGPDKFYEYVKRTIDYPEDAKRDSITGDVHVEFTVGVDGSILPSSVKVVKGLSTSCDAEAVRVIKAAPKWTAATAKSELIEKKTDLIEQRVTFPVSFSLQ